jgi:DNA-binding NarL/FixJ family response regulator
MTLVRFPRRRNAASVLKWREPAGGLSSLSERERGVLALLVKGLTNREIAEELGVSAETVKKHISQALSKTRLKTRTALAPRAATEE